MEKSLAKAGTVKLFVHDIHGVLTRNTFFCDAGGRIHHGWHRMDGFGALSLLSNGIHVALLDATSIDQEGLRWARGLKLDRCYHAVRDKEDKLGQLKQNLAVSDGEVAYVGCEITDLELMKKAGFAIATSDAVVEVKEIADFITTAPGGGGIIRETSEFILRAMGKWDAWVENVLKLGYDGLLASVEKMSDTDIIA